VNPGQIPVNQSPRVPYTRNEVGDRSKARRRTAGVDSDGGDDDWTVCYRDQVGLPGGQPDDRAVVCWVVLDGDDPGWRVVRARRPQAS